MSGSEGKIPKVVFKAVAGLVFGIAITTVVTRTIIRLRVQKRLHLDDHLLLFSCVCLTAATAVLYHGISTVYSVQESSNIPTDEAHVLQLIAFIQRVSWSFNALSWASIFAIKFAFLSFFGPLVDRLPSTHRYWKVVIILTAMISPIAILDDIIACPKLGLDALQCSQTKWGLRRALAIRLTAIFQDITTDLLILLIPMSLVWRVHFKPRQKFGLGALFCLNGCMIIVAIIRISGIHYNGQVDSSWDLLWLQVESCVAVTLQSLTAFRSIFVGRIVKPREKRRGGVWPASTSRGVNKHRKLNSRDQSRVNLTIPSATLTGMRTLIRDYETEPACNMDESPLAGQYS